MKAPDLNETLINEGPDAARERMDKAKRYRSEKTNGSEQPSNKEKPPPELVTKLASEYRMKSISWLWPNRYAVGKLGLLAGLPERGKGLISADMTRASLQATHGLATRAAHRKAMC